MLGGRGRKEDNMSLLNELELKILFYFCICRLSLASKRQIANLFQGWEVNTTALLLRQEAYRERSKGKHMILS